MAAPPVILTDIYISSFTRSRELYGNFLPLYEICPKIIYFRSRIFLRIFQYTAPIFKIGKYVHFCPKSVLGLDTLILVQLGRELVRDDRKTPNKCLREPNVIWTKPSPPDSHLHQQNFWENLPKNVIFLDFCRFLGKFTEASFGSNRSGIGAKSSEDTN